VDTKKCLKKYGIDNISMKIRDELKKEVANLFIELNTECSSDIFYVGFTLYKKQFSGWIIYYTFNVFKNQVGGITTDENTFSGFYLNKISVEPCITKSDLNYLPIFFKNLYWDSSMKKVAYIYTNFKEDDNLALQLTVITSTNTNRQGFPPAVAKCVENKIKSFLSKPPITCINHFVKRYRIYDDWKSNFRLLTDEVLLVVDLIRTKDRCREEYKIMDAIISYKLTSELKEIAGKANFKSLNHLGDGYLFIYRGERTSLQDDILYFINESNRVLKFILKHLSMFNETISSYRVRGIISQCNEVLEIDYLNSANLKLYFSCDLDSVFEDLAKLDIELSNKKDVLLSEYTYIWLAVEENLLSRSIIEKYQERLQIRPGKNYVLVLPESE